MGERLAVYHVYPLSCRDIVNVWMRGDRIDRAEQQIVIPEEFVPFPAHFGALLVEGKPFPMKQRIAAQSTRLGGLIVAIEGPSGEPERTICDFQAAANTARSTGFSTIGRLMTAENTPSKIVSPQTTS